jgi:hypothetical protein
MLTSILTIIVVLLIGAFIGAGVLVAILWVSVDKD